jgi:hypothetical protein
MSAGRHRATRLRRRFRAEVSNRSETDARPCRSSRSFRDAASGWVVLSKPMRE